MGMRKATKPRRQSDEYALASAEQQPEIPEEGLTMAESRGQTDDYTAMRPNSQYEHIEAGSATAES
jgi:hypothetical protein